MGIIKLICDRKEERVRQGRKVTAVDGRYFKLAENLLYGELEVAATYHKSIYALLSPEEIREFLNTKGTGGESSGYS